MAASIQILVDEVLKEFNGATSKPETFLSIQGDLNSKFKSITKHLYDFGNQYCPIQGLSGGLPELHTAEFDEEQIWQQLELHNESAFRILMKSTVKLLSVKREKFTFHTTDTFASLEASEGEVPEENEEAKDDDSVASDLSFQISTDSEDEAESDPDEFGELEFDEYQVLEDEKGNEKLKKNTKIKQPKPYKKTEVDDQFFKLREMEDFLQKEEAEKPEHEENDDDSIDFFEGVPSEDDEEDKAIHAKYKDFFRGSIPASNRKRSNQDEDQGDEVGEQDQEEEVDDIGEEDEDLVAGPQEKRVKFNVDGESSDGESDDDIQKFNDVKSSYELRQERLRAKIKDLEEEAVAPKPWQLMGETKADLRPENALLEEDLFFDHTTRQAPVITEETTRTLEDIIRQRIKDLAFDDVERKIKPIYDPSEYKKKLVLDQEKSKFSLAEIYEQEYLKQQELQEKGGKTVSSLADPIPVKASESKAQLKIQKMMSDLFSKLDALCNFHYTPRMPVPEVKIVSNMPSIAMEEIAPVTVSDANLLAPEEVQAPLRGELQTSTEKEKTDRLRERRKKKSIQRIKHKEKERSEKAVNKANPGLGNIHARTRALHQLQKAEKEGTVSLIKENRSKAPKSSTAFFSQLQDEVAATVDAVKKSKHNSVKKRNVTGPQLKL